MNKVLKRVLAVVGIAAAGGLIHKIKNMPPEKYSLEWIKSLSDSMWEKERESVRQDMCNPRLGADVQAKCQNILRLFDKVKSERNWAGKTPKGPSYSREHGFNLYKPD